MSGLEQQLASYRSHVEAFRWDVPDAFNFGRDVVDRHAADPTLPALLWRSSAGYCWWRTTSTTAWPMTARYRRP